MNPIHDTQISIFLFVIDTTADRLDFEAVIAVLGLMFVRLVAELQISVHHLMLVSE